MRIRMRRLTATTFLVLLQTFSVCTLADTLYLRDGEQVSGSLKQMTAETVVFDARDGLKTWPKSDVLRIQLQRARPYDDVETADQIVEADLKACIATQPSEADFPADGFVTLLERLTFDLSEPGTVKKTERRILKVLRQRGEDVGSENVWYFEDTDAPEIDFALTVTPDGRVLHLSDAALKNEVLYAQLPAYRRLARYRFACKEPRPGSILDVQHTVRLKRGTPLEPFYAGVLFREGAPILRKEVVVIVPSAQEEEVAVQLAGPEVVRFARGGRDGVVRLAWMLAEPQPGIRGEPLMPPKKQFAPSLTLGRAATWEHVAAAYAAALEAVPPLTKELEAKAVELAGNGGAEAIYSFVARNVRTAPVAQWQFRITPYPPAETASRGLANELDKNFLYMKMLEAAGIECTFALVRSRNRGPLSEQVPSLRAFDRSAVHLVEKGVYSNVSSDRLAFGVLPAGLHDAPALLIVPKGATPTRTQGVLPEQERETTRFEAALDADGGLDITVRYSGLGNSGAWMRGWKDLDEQELRNRIEQVAGSLHPAAVLEDYETTDLADLAADPAITVHCAIPGYAVKAGDALMFFNIPTVSYSAAEVGRPTREYDLMWGHVRREVCEGVVHLPEGFKVHSKPASVRFASPTVTYKAKVKARRGRIVFEDVYDLKVDAAPRDAYADYKACLERRADIPRQRVILVRKGRAAAEELAK